MITAAENWNPSARIRSQSPEGGFRYGGSRTRQPRPTTAEDLHRLAALAHTRGLRLTQESETVWFCCSASQHGEPHYVTGLSCDCRGFQEHQRCTPLRAAARSPGLVARGRGRARHGTRARCVPVVPGSGRIPNDDQRAVRPLRGLRRHRPAIRSARRACRLASVRWGGLARSPPSPRTGDHDDAHRSAPDAQFAETTARRRHQGAITIILASETASATPAMSPPSTCSTHPGGDCLRGDFAASMRSSGPHGSSSSCNGRQARRRRGSWPTLVELRDQPEGYSPLTLLTSLLPDEPRSPHRPVLP